MKEERAVYTAIILLAIRKAISIGHLELWHKEVLDSKEQRIIRFELGITAGTPERAKIIAAYNERKEQLLAEQIKEAA